MPAFEMSHAVSDTQADSATMLCTDLRDPRALTFAVAPLHSSLRVVSQVLSLTSDANVYVWRVCWWWWGMAALTPLVPAGSPFRRPRCSQQSTQVSGSRTHGGV